MYRGQNELLPMIIEATAAINAAVLYVLFFIWGKLSLESRSSNLMLCWHLPAGGRWGEKREEKNKSFYSWRVQEIERVNDQVYCPWSHGDIFCWSEWAGVRPCVTSRKIPNGPTTTQNQFLHYFFPFTVRVKGWFVSNLIALLHSLHSIISRSPASLGLLPWAANLTIYNVKNYSLCVSRCWCHFISLITKVPVTESWQKYRVIEVLV